MVNSLFYNQLADYYKLNLENYIKHHPGEFILIENPFGESFYKTKSELENAIKEKDKGIYGWTIFTTQIPKEIPKKA